MKTTSRPTSEILTLGMTAREYVRFNDGSLRRKVAKPKGKAEAKRLKRQRDCTNKFRNRVI